MAFDSERYNALRRALTTQGVTLYGTRVLVMRDDALSETKGGIVIPDMAQKRERVGTVVLLGEGFIAKSDELYVSGVQVGDRITMNQYDGKEVSIDTSCGQMLCDITHIGNLYMGWKNKELS